MVACKKYKYMHIHNHYSSCISKLHSNISTTKLESIAELPNCEVSTHVVILFSLSGCIDIYTAKNKWSF